MIKPVRVAGSGSNRRVELPVEQRPEDPVEEASQESFPASDSPGWSAEDKAASAPSPSVEIKAEPKQGCALSFLTEERDEMDKLCERTPSEQREEYTQPETEKEVGGEG